jgi:hypothetical protein
VRTFPSGLNWQIEEVFPLSPTPTPTQTPTVTPTVTPTPTNTPTPTQTPTVTPSPTPVDVLINPIITENDYYIIIGDNEYFKFVDPI